MMDRKFIRQQNMTKNPSLAKEARCSEALLKSKGLSKRSRGGRVNNQLPWKFQFRIRHVRGHMIHGNVQRPKHEDMSDFGNSLRELKFWRIHQWMPVM